jgi:hypothetical protein
VKRDPSFHLLVFSSDIRSTKPTGNDDFNPECAGLHCPLNRQPDRPPVCDSALNLLSNAPANQDGIEFWLPHFLDVQTSALFSHLLKLNTKLIHALSPAADDDAGASRVDRNYEVLRATLDLDLGNCAAVTKPCKHQRADCVVFGSQLTVFAATVSKPVGLPVHHAAQAETYWVSLLSH